MKLFHVIGFRLLAVGMAIISQGWAQDAHVKARALNIMSEIKGDYIPPASLQALANLGPEGQKALVQIMHDGSQPWQHRSISALALSEQNPRSALVHLEKGQRDAHVLVRLACVKALAKYRGEDASNLLVYSLDDKAMVVRNAAVKALGTRSDNAALNGLHRALQSEANYKQGYWIFDYILESIEKRGSKRSIAPLMEVLKNPKARHWQAGICKSLARIADVPSGTRSLNFEGKHCGENWLKWYAGKY